MNRLRHDIESVAARMAEAGWVFAMDQVMRPPSLRHHDEQAVAAAEEMLGRRLPSLLRNFALEIGMVSLVGRAEAGSTLAKAAPTLVTEAGAASFAPLVTVPLPVALGELEMALEEDLEPGVPIIDDATTIAGLSGGPPLAVLFDPDHPDATPLFVDLDADAPLELDLEAYLRTCLRQGGFFALPDDPIAAAALHVIGQGLGSF